MTDKPDTAAARALCDEIEKLAKKATKGPWRPGIPGNFSIYAPDGLGADSDGIAYCYGPRAPENRQFIARSREAVPALISHVRALAGEVERLGADVDEWKAAGGYREQVEFEQGVKGQWRQRAELAEAERDALLAKVKGGEDE